MKDRRNVKYLMKIRGLLQKVLPVSIIFLTFFGIFLLNLSYNFNDKEYEENLNQSEPESPRCARTDQDWNITWGGSSTEYGFGIYNDSAGNVFISGYTTSFGAGGEAVLIKYNADGIQLWNRTWGGSSVDYGTDVTVDSAGNAYLAGYTQSFGIGSRDLFVVKYNSTGTQVWNKTWGGSQEENLGRIAISPDNCVYLSGDTTSFGVGSVDGVIVKYAGDGIQLWNRTWGGISSDSGTDVAVNDAGTVYLTGNTASFGVGSSDAFIAAFDETGFSLWNSTWGGSATESCYGIAARTDGSIFITGYTYSFGAGSGDTFIAKFDDDGTRLWNRTWGSSKNEQGQDVVISPSGCPYIIGYLQTAGIGYEDAFVLVYNDTGQLTWNRTWGGSRSDYGMGLLSNSNGSLYFAGMTYSMGIGTPGSSNIFLAYICGDLKCSHPNDQIWQLGNSGNLLSWMPIDLCTGTTSYIIEKNDSFFASETWISNALITVSLDTLPAGVFNFTIILSDGIGQIVTDEVWIDVRSRYVQGYALVIGINDYPGTDLDLMYPVADANSIENMLKGVGFPAENIEKLTDSAATKSNIIAKINAIRQKATRNDLFVMYYSGHGDRQVDQSTEKICSYSTTHNYPNNYDVHWTIHEEGALAIRVQFSNFNTEAENDLGFVSDPELYAEGYGIVYSGNLGTFWSDWMLGDTLIVGMVSNEYRTYYGFDVKKYEIATGFDSTIVNQDFESVGEFMGHDLDSYLDALPCLNQYYFFDSCMSGGLIDDLAQRGRTISTACTDEEISWETSELGHGVYTYYLLQVFNKNAGNYVHDLNGDKQIDVVEMFNWTEPNTITKSGQLGEVQHPQFYNNPIGCGIWNLTLLNIDADGDRLCDWGETNYWGSDPFDIESDHDGLLDGDEVELYGSSPAKFDTDSDQLGDWEEVMIHHTNPASSDTDSDLLLDLEEIYTYRTNPSVADSDGDNLTDGLEVLTYNTNPLNVDSDSDTLWDGPEVYTYYTNPLNPDSDGDGFSDGIEVFLGANPLDNFSPWNIILLIGILVSLAILVTFGVKRYRKIVAARPPKPQRAYYPRPESTYRPPQQAYSSPVPTRDTLDVDFTPDGIPIYEGLTEPQWVAIGKRFMAEGRTADAEMCFRIAYILLRTKKPTGWKDQSQFTSQSSPSPVSAMAPMARARFYFEKGCSQYRDGLYFDAEQSFRAALKNDPSHAEAWRFLGLALVQLDEKGEAERAFWNAVHYDPNNPRGWANLGDLLLDQGIPSEAEIAFRRCLEVAPPGWSWRALAEKKLQQAKSRAYKEQGLNDERASTTSLHEIPLPDNELDPETKTPDNLPPQKEPSQDTPEVENKQTQGEKPVEASSETHITPDPEFAQPTVEDVPEEQEIPQSLGNEAPTEVYVDNQSGEQIPLIPISPTSTPESTSQVKPPPEMEIIEKCGFCGNLVKNRECISCGAKVCPWCKEMNFATATVCVNCGKDLYI